MVNYIINYTANGKPFGADVFKLNKFDKTQLQNKFDEYAAKMQPGDILEYIRDDLSSKKMGGTLLYVENEKGINYIYNLNNNRKKKYNVQPIAQPKSEAYGKPKQGVQNNYPKEIAQQTGTRESSVATWLKTNEVDPMTILQGVGSGRIKRQDFVEALLSDEGTLEFLNKYNSDGKWSSVWKATPKNTQESLSEMIRRVIKEEKYDKDTQEEVDMFYKNFYTAMNNLELIQKSTKNDKFRIYIRQMDDIANAIIEITG